MKTRDVPLPSSPGSAIVITAVTGLAVLAAVIVNQLSEYLGINGMTVTKGYPVPAAKALLTDVEAEFQEPE